MADQVRWFEPLGTCACGKSILMLLARFNLSRGLGMRLLDAGRRFWFFHAVDCDRMGCSCNGPGEKHGNGETKGAWFRSIAGDRNVTGRRSAGRRFPPLREIAHRPVRPGHHVSRPVRLVASSAPSMTSALARPRRSGPSGGPGRIVPGREREGCLRGRPSALSRIGPLQVEDRDSRTVRCGKAAGRSARHLPRACARGLMMRSFFATS